MEVKATFIGTDSLGYEKNKEYWLYISETDDSYPIVVYRVQDDKTWLESYCPYETVSAFLKNWTNIQTV